MSKTDSATKTTNIITALIQSGLPFSFRYHKNGNGKMQAVIYAKESAVECRQMFPHNFELKLDSRQDFFAEAVIVQDR